MPDDAPAPVHGPAADPLPAALLAIAEHEEQIAQLAGLLGDVGERLQALERQADERQAGERTDSAGYTPIPAPRWWLLPTADRADAVDRLAAWVQQVYAPSYGHLARMLAPCWRDHDLCLFILDLASELHSVLYLRPSRTARTLADQAEFSLRILPAAVELMRAETARCDHPSAHGSPAAMVPMKETGPTGASAPGRARSFTRQVTGHE